MFVIVTTLGDTLVELHLLYLGLIFKFNVSVFQEVLIHHEDYTNFATYLG